MNFTGRMNYQRQKQRQERSKGAETDLAPPLETHIDSSCVKTPNSLKDFLSSMQPTPNALTYQAWTHRALCPHITDFLLRTNGKTRSCVSGLCRLTNLFLWVLCVFGVGGGTNPSIGILYFPLPEKPSHLWTSTRGHRERNLNKWNEYAWLAASMLLTEYKLHK